MKRYILLLLSIMVATVSMASDVITKKNGTTFQCKVVKVGRTEVEYKNITNLNGPIYAIDLTEVSSIKYENGAVDRFEEQSALTTNAGQRTMTDGDLMRMYNQMSKNSPGRGLRKTGLIVGAAGIAIAVISANLDANCSNDIYLLGYIAGGSCIGVGAALFTVGVKKKQHEKFAYAPIFQHDFQFGDNSLLTADVNIINDNATHDKSLALGLRFTF